jgi:hypothetical protein
MYQKIFSLPLEAKFERKKNDYSVELFGLAGRIKRKTQTSKGFSEGKGEFCSLAAFLATHRVGQAQAVMRE